MFNQESPTLKFGVGEYLLVDAEFDKLYGTNPKP